MGVRGAAGPGRCCQAQVWEIWVLLIGFPLLSWPVDAGGGGSVMQSALNKAVASPVLFFF